MLEVAMIVCLAIMGVYFVKSADLPKELKERSAQYHTDSNRVDVKKPLKITIPNKIEKAATAIDNNQQAKLAEMKLHKKTIEIQILNKEIDRLTMLITTLEQEIKANNERNAEIQTIIDGHLANLQSLQEKINSLA